jgi:hypothetical protein
MVVITCPWCQEDAPLDSTSFSQEFHCEQCGTSALLADDLEYALDLAA